jgi:hypothetical protein
LVKYEPGESDPELAGIVNFSEVAPEARIAVARA